MKKKSQFYISLLFLVAILSSCEDEPIQPIDMLPPATNEGKNTFGCLIDGEAFIPNYVGGGAGANATYNSFSHRFAAGGSMEDKNGVLKRVGFLVFLDSGIGTYIMDDIGNEQSIYNNYDPANNCGFFDGDPENPGTVVITRLDTANYIISGVFRMDVISEHCPDKVIHITEGRFDMRY